MTSADLLALVTLVLALATVGLARVSYRQLRLSIRPFLADPLPAEEGAEETLLFGAPGRISPRVPRGALFYTHERPGAFHFSVAFENVGAGVAAVTGADVDPDVSAGVHISRKFVPVGALVRVNVSVLTELPEAEQFRDQFWAMGGVTVSVHYTDANGKQPLMTRAVITQAATQGPWVHEIAVFREGRAKPIAVGQGSY